MQHFLAALAPSFVRLRCLALSLSLSLREQSPQALAKYCIIVIGPLRYCLLLIVAARRVRCFHCVLFMFFGVREKVQQNKVAHRDRHRQRHRQRKRESKSKQRNYIQISRGRMWHVCDAIGRDEPLVDLTTNPRRSPAPAQFAKWKCVCALRTHKTREIKACHIKAALPHRHRWQPCSAHFMTARSTNLIQMSVLHCSKIQYLVFCCCWWQLYDRHGDT